MKQFMEDFKKLSNSEQESYLALLQQEKDLLEKLHPEDLPESPDANKVLAALTLRNKVRRNSDPKLKTDLKNRIKDIRNKQEKIWTSIYLKMEDKNDLYKKELNKIKATIERVDEIKNLTIQDKRKYIITLVNVISSYNKYIEEFNSIVLMLTEWKKDVDQFLLNIDKDMRIDPNFNAIHDYHLDYKNKPIDNESLKEELGIKSGLFLEDNFI